jgi:hypothetical protein
MIFPINVAGLSARVTDAQPVSTPASPAEQSRPCASLAPLQRYLSLRAAARTRTMPTEGHMRRWRAYAATRRQERTR